jgi:hypothetical protein
LLSIVAVIWPATSPALVKVALARPPIPGMMT